MTQVNRSSFRSRRLRILDPYERLPIASTAAAATTTGAQAPPHMQQDGDRGHTATVGGGASLPSWEFQTGHGWANCDVPVQALLRGTEASGETRVEFESRGFSYVFDLEKFT